MAIYFFYGDEDYLIDKEIEKLKKGLDKNFLDMSFKTYDCPDFPELISILRTQPMMFGKMFIVINCYDYFSKSFEDKELKQIASALEDNNENLDIAFVAKIPRNSGKKLDSRKKFFKTLKGYNSKEINTIPLYKTAELEDWITKLAKSKDLKVEKDAANAMIIQIGNNIRQFDVELDKLKLFTYPKNIVTAAMVKEYCISNEDLFAFSDFLLQGEKDKALLEYKKLLDKKFPMEILATLQTLVRRWIILKAKSKQLSGFELSKLTGMHEYVIQLTLKKMKNVSLKDLVKLKKQLTSAEYRIKSGQVADMQDEIMKAFIV